MISRGRVWTIFMITLAIILAQVNLASSQKITVGGSNRGENSRVDHGANGGTIDWAHHASIADDGGN